jgi:hypothetical protein
MLTVPPASVAFRRICRLCMWLGLAWTSSSDLQAQAVMPNGGASRASASVGPSLPELVFLKPGTGVLDKQPAGWSHLVIRSVPRLASGDLRSLPASAATTATLFRTVILADVRRGSNDRGEYRLARIGVAMCVPRKEGDVVVDPANASALGISLSAVQRIVLDRAQTELARGRLVVRTPTFALFRTPATIVGGQRHRAADLYYGFLVDARTGHLQTLVWSVVTSPESRSSPKSVVVMSPAQVFDCALDVSASRLLGALPVSWSFAMAYLPRGEKAAAPPRLMDQIEAASLDRSRAVDIEAALRRTLAQSEKDLVKPGQAVDPQVFPVTVESRNRSGH